MNLRPTINRFGQGAVALFAFCVLVVMLCYACGCAHMRETSVTIDRFGNTNIYERVSTDLGTGKRTQLMGSNGMMTTHSEIPQTLNAAGGLAGTIGGAMATGGGTVAAKKAVELVKTNTVTAIEPP